MSAHTAGTPAVSMRQLGNCSIIMTRMDDTIRLLGTEKIQFCSDLGYESWLFVPATYPQ